MAATEAESAEAEEPAFTLPPRPPGRLARYSRTSKLGATGAGLAGLVSLVYLISYLLPNHTLVEIAKHQPPAVQNADTMEPLPPADIGSSSVQQAKPAPASPGQELNPQDAAITMAAAPDAALTESTPTGDLPRIADDGRKPWQVYARPFNADDTRPRLAVLVADLGMQRAIAGAAIAQLPGGVSLAFDVQSPGLGKWCARARQEGHEVLLSVPMEPFDFPHSDPGPHTLLTSLPDDANLEKLTWALQQASGYVGITTFSGSRFTTETDKLRPVMDTLHQRGLMMLDARIALHSAIGDLARTLRVPTATATLHIDDDLSPEAVDAALHQLEQTARLNGSAIGIVAPVPIVMDQLRAWLKTLPANGIALAPVSAIVQEDKE